MSDVIKLLPDSVANQIAAGEVIQRPASVIKELVENAIDAHAKSIQIILKDAGRTLIQVVDDGDGMSDTDARLAFERHSTSKIRKAADLFTLHTMGFRGEALASIAAIAQVELRTQKSDASIGTKIEINASKCESQEPIACALGSNFMVKNLFFNVPARRKFLKSNQVELSNIVREFERLALVNPKIEFKIVHNDNVIYQLRVGTFKQRIAELFGRTFENQLIPVNIDTSLIKIKGFVCRPENARKRNQQQFFFVNGRYMRHPYFHKAIITSYEQLIPDDEQPNYFLNFEVSPESIDVNIHPTKTEIKFENEQSIWQIISAAVKETLGKYSIAPSIDFDTEGAPEIPIFDGDRNREAPPIDFDPNYNPFEKKNATPSYNPAQKATVNNDWNKLFANFEKSKNDIGIRPDEGDIQNGDEGNGITPLFNPNDIVLPSYIQLKNRYILSPAKSGLMVIDQHRAHIRVLYDNLMKRYSSHQSMTQQVMFPEVLHLSPAENLILEDLEDDIKKVGFDIAFLGNDSWSINGIPTGIEGIDSKDLLHKVIESAEKGGESIETQMCEKMILEIAKRAAIPYGKALSQEEMDKMQSELLQLPSPNYTPDGKAIISVITMDNISKLF